MGFQFLQIKLGTTKEGIPNAKNPRYNVQKERL